jgi:hypothetical protein
MMKLFPLFLLAASFSAAHAGNNELDPAAAAAPSGLIVQTDASGNTQVFKADGIAQSQITDAQSAQAAIATYVTTANQVSKVVPQSELDQTSSDQAWYYYYNPVYNPYCSYNYGYNYYGYNYNYRPFYNYGFGNYYYYYYYRY